MDELRSSIKSRITFGTVFMKRVTDLSNVLLGHHHITITRAPIEIFGACHLAVSHCRAEVDTISRYDQCHKKKSADRAKLRKTLQIVDKSC